MKTVTAYTHASRAGLVAIRLKGNRWHIDINGEDLGSYHTARNALDDLIGGHCFWPSSGDPSALGLPDELSEWDSAS